MLMNGKFAVYPVIEEEETTMPGEDGKEITVPVNIMSANPNQVEFDNLYLDMNGIVSIQQSCPHLD